VLEAGTKRKRTAGAEDQLFPRFVASNRTIILSIEPVCALSHTCAFKPQINQLVDRVTKVDPEGLNQCLQSAEGLNIFFTAPVRNLVGVAAIKTQIKATSKVKLRKQTVLNDSLIVVFRTWQG
jgi:hypothetical protein